MDFPKGSFIYNINTLAVSGGKWVLVIEFIMAPLVKQFSKLCVDDTGGFSCISESEQFDLGKQTRRLT
ncbi:MAG: hypothetical protein GPOALKHO_001156 [Sodalis sp.]|uniref:hypothetical protein n=1 Tax=Sodalis sp. (in: enterobacteria) TaxID=1898979 RepID=UPI00387388C5|nr:MAG: hypothetical protein GPOALKHO_001156 [Sodalis sp.]